jgi:hypothetical protein
VLDLMYIGRIFHAQRPRQELRKIIQNSPSFLHFQFI